MESPDEQHRLRKLLGHGTRLVIAIVLAAK